MINNLIKANLINKNKKNYDYNTNTNNKIFSKESSYLNNIINFNSIKKLYDIPKIDISKLDKNDNNILTITNRNVSRNNNGIFKWISKTVTKNYRKKNKIIIRNVIPKFPFSPLNKNKKNIFKKNSDIKFLYSTNNKNIKSLSCKKQGEGYSSNKNVIDYNKNKNLEIKDYKFKKKNYLNINFD